MVTRKIAKNGMKGRKLESLLLVLVLLFTFLFIVAAILLETSMSETKQAQRCRLYGSWHAAYLGADPETRGRLLDEPEVTGSAVSGILGKDDRAGTVGSIQENLIEMGNLTFQEGRMPQGADEVLIESNIADALGLEEPVGEEITLTIRNTLVQESMEEYISETDEELAVSRAYDPMFSGGYARRQLFEQENVGDAVLSLESRYCIINGMGEQITPERIEQEGFLYEQDITYARKYTVCGVIDSYSAFWDTGNLPVANVFLSEEGASEVEQAVIQTGLKDLSGFSFPSNVFCTSGRQKERLFHALEGTYGQEAALGQAEFCRNTYAYPEASGSMEERLVVLVIAVIFLIAFCAVFQVFMTQVKRRIRKIALLKSIGATNGQICGMLLWEGAYLLLYSMPIGTACGFAAGYAAVKLLDSYGGMELTFCCKPGLVLLGIAAGCLALFAGMAIPMGKALRVPLIGTISVSSGRKKHGVCRIRKRRGSQRILTFRNVSKAHRKRNWKQTALTGTITIVTAILVFSSLYLGYAAFGTYISDVVEGNRPSYVLRAPHGYDRHDLKVLKEQIEEELPESSLTTYLKINKVNLQYDTIEESPLIQAYKELLPKDRYRDFIGSEPTNQEQLRGTPDDLSMVLGSIRTTLYTIDTSGDFYDKIKAMVNEGEVDDTSFVQGKSVILAIPMYQKGNGKPSKEHAVPESVTDTEMFSYVLSSLGGYRLSYEKRDAGRYQKDTSIKPKDTVKISRMVEVIAEYKPPISYVTSEVEVAGIVYYAPEERPYPFFADEDGFAVIASSGFLADFAPDALSNPALKGDDQTGNEGQFAFMLSQCPTMFGETCINVYTEDGASDIKSASHVIKAGKGYGMEFTNYNEENWNLYFGALNTAVMLGMLGGTSLIIALMILWNINMSAFEQERPRIGVLQALGVTNGELCRDYLAHGMKSGLLSLLVSHLALAGVMFLSQGLQWNLYLYPWAAHVLLCVAFFLLVTIVNCGPCLPIRKYSPNENVTLKQ